MVWRTPYSLKTTFLEQLIVWGWQAEHTSQGQGRIWGVFSCPSPAHGAICSHCLPYDLHQHSCTAGGSINWKNVWCCPIKVNKSILDGPWAHSWVYNACIYACSNACRMFGAALLLKGKIGSTLRAFHRRMDKYKLEYYTTEKMKE